MVINRNFINNERKRKLLPSMSWTDVGHAVRAGCVEGESAGLRFRAERFRAERFCAERVKLSTVPTKPVFHDKKMILEARNWAKRC